MDGGGVTGCLFFLSFTQSFLLYDLTVELKYGFKKSCAIGKEFELNHLPETFHLFLFISLFHNVTPLSFSIAIHLYQSVRRLSRGFGLCDNKVSASAGRPDTQGEEEEEGWGFT